MGLGGDGHSLDGCGTMGNEAGGCEEVVVEIESATGTRQGDPLGGVLLALGHQQAPCVLLPRHFQISHFHRSLMIPI